MYDKTQTGLRGIETWYQLEYHPYLNKYVAHTYYQVRIFGGFEMNTLIFKGIASRFQDWNAILYSFYCTS